MSRVITVEALKFLAQSFTCVEETAIRQRTCKRKAVGCQLFRLLGGAVTTQTPVFTNKSVTGECTNVVGDCGCSHAEPSAIVYALRHNFMLRLNTLLCLYSPCTNCANLIVMSNFVRLVLYDILTMHDQRGLGILEAGGVAVVTKDDLITLIRDEQGEQTFLLTNRNTETRDKLIRAQETG